MQSVHHAFIKLKAGDFVPADANFIPGRLVPFSRFRWSPASRWRGNLLAGWLTPSVHGALLLRLPLCRRRYSRLVDDAFGMANGEQATCRNAGSASS